MDLTPQESSLVPQDMNRDVMEVQAQIILSKKFPRDENLSILKINKMCERKTLAESALYSYERGKTNVTGASIRLAEAIATAWGNITYGTKELSNDGDYTEVESFAWDLESNVRVSKKFKVKLERKANGKFVKITDPRDQYEHVMSYAMRRVRACLLEVIPKDITEMAEDACRATLKKSDVPLSKRIENMLLAFSKLGVSKAMIEMRLEHKSEDINLDEIVELTTIFNSIKDGASKREAWFTFEGAPEKDDKTQNLADKLGANGK